MKTVLDYKTFRMIFEFDTDDITLGGNTVLESFDIYETIGAIPYFKLTLVNEDINSFTDLKDIKLSYSSDNLSYTCNLGVNIIQEIKGGITISGWMVEQDKFKTVRTRYLGNNIKTALNRLAIRDTINLKDNPNLNIFQINQTDACQALLVCKYAAKTPFWSIGRHSINLDEKFGEDNEDSLPTMTGARIITNNSYNILDNESKWISTVSSRDFYHIVNTDEFTASKNRMDLVEQTTIGLKYMSTGFYSGEYPHPIGTVFKNRNSYYNEVSQWVVASCYYHYISKSMSTDIQYFGLTN